MSDSRHKQIMPLNQQPAEDPAVALVRAKLQALYQEEPSAKEEIQEVEAVTHGRTKHQQFIYQLNHSGKSVAEIQTAWHAYYAALPDNEKHEVWREFYAAHQQASQMLQQHLRPNPTIIEAEMTTQPPSEEPDKPKPVRRPRRKSTRHNEAEMKQLLLNTVYQRSQNKLSRKDHFKSLAFGLGMGLLVVFILMFTFFNERFITPFITPSTRVSASPIIVDPTSNNNVGPDPRVIIPKINVDIPVLYNVASDDEATVQRGLSEAVVHYPSTPNPGELGNGVIFGHSSGNIFDKSKAKFAFLQLREVNEGDTFYLNKDGKQYVYKVIAKRVVPPTEVGVINDTFGKPATFTLITCDPPGLNVNRMVLTGEQISPAPANNQKSTAPTATSSRLVTLPGNSESLWHHFITWLTK